MSTRFGNLKRHLKRKHGGAGKPILQYISGNSIITPSDTSSSFQIFPDENTIKQTQDPSRWRNTRPMTGNDDSLDKWFNRYVEPLMKIAELRGRINSVNQSWITNPPTYFAQNHGHPFQSFHTDPASVRVDKNSGDHDSIDRNYDDISGFKADVCVKCLGTITLRTGEKNTSIHDFHKCDFERENWVANYSLGCM